MALEHCQHVGLALRSGARLSHGLSPVLNSDTMSRAEVVLIIVVLVLVLIVIVLAWTSRPLPMLTPI